MIVDKKLSKKISADAIHATAGVKGYKLRWLRSWGTVWGKSSAIEMPPQKKKNKEKKIASRQKSAHNLSFWYFVCKIWWRERQEWNWIWCKSVIIRWVLKGNTYKLPCDTETYWKCDRQTDLGSEYVREESNEKENGYRNAFTSKNKAERERERKIDR